MRDYRTLFLVPALCLSTAVAACGRVDWPIVHGGRPDRLVAVFVDVSATVSDADWTIYRQTFQQLIREDGPLDPGDRVVLATISSTTLTGFVPVEDVAFPDSGVAADDRDGAALQRLRLGAAFDRIRAGRGDGRRGGETHVVDAAHVAAQLFRNDIRRTSRYCLYLTDGLEESRDANFRLNPPGTSDTEALVARLRVAGRLPALQGTRVVVVGARASSPEAMVAVEHFWRRFFAAAGAEMRPGDYSRAGAELNLE
jgi:hypothetical protein